MPNYEIQKKDHTEIPAHQTQQFPEMTQEQITKSILDIILQRTNESEAELMKLENAELKQILANFGKNYNKFEDLTKNTIQQNSDELMRLIGALRSSQDEKLKSLKQSNDEVNENIATMIGNIKKEISKDITGIYEKIQKETGQNLKKYNESITALEKKSKEFWKFTGIKEALFWSMCISMLIFISVSMMNAWGITLPIIVWQILYPCAFIPLVGYAIRIITDKKK